MQNHWKYWEMIVIYYIWKDTDQNQFKSLKMLKDWSFTTKYHVDQTLYGRQQLNQHITDFDLTKHGMQV